MVLDRWKLVDDNLNCSLNYPFNIYSVAMWHIRSHQKPCPNPTVVCPVWISVYGTVFFWVGNQQPKPVTSMFICIYAIVLDCDVLVLAQHARLCYFTIRFPHANIPWVLTDMHLPPQVLQVWLDNGVFCIKTFPVFFFCQCTQAPREHLCGLIQCVLPATTCSRVS